MQLIPKYQTPTLGFYISRPITGVPFKHGYMGYRNPKTGKIHVLNYGASRDANNNAMLEEIVLDNVRFKDVSNPTQNEINNLISAISTKKNKRGRAIESLTQSPETTIDYVNDVDFEKMDSIAKSLLDPKNAQSYQNIGYNVLTNNCGQVAHKMLLEGRSLYEYNTMPIPWNTTGANLLVVNGGLNLLGLLKELAKWGKPINWKLVAKSCTLGPTNPFPSTLVTPGSQHFKNEAP